MVNRRGVKGHSFCTACILGMVLAATRVFAEEPGHLTVSVDKPGAKLPPTFYGLMTEEINYSYDGGLYGELIQNRIFKDEKRVGRAAADPAVVPHWTPLDTDTATAAVVLDNADPVNKTALTTSLRMEIKGADKAHRAGVSNDGYWGIPIKPNVEYKCSFYARAKAGFAGTLTVDIESNDGGTIHATAQVPELTDKWKKYEVTLKTGEATAVPNGRFVISTNSEGTVWLNLVSLFPPTYKDRANGFRPDIMALLAGLHPDILRFPGGNYVEGNDFANYFNWRITVGKYEDRPGHMSPWKYRSSDGMGLLEFLNWCEDLKMEPVLAVFAGHVLQGGKNSAVTGDALKPYVQDALDEVEYVIGDKATTYGAMRARDGHPAPFKLTYVEIGNEDNLSGGKPTYDERFTAFYDAIKLKYPKLQLISTMPPTGPNASTLARRPDVIDDHQYDLATAMMRRATRFDKYDRKNPKIFMGEWASNGKGQGNPTPNLLSALGDAAFLSGLERNCDVVVMQCYAPLLVNVNPGGSQWPTNLIGYNSLVSFGSPSYYAQKMFSENRGDVVLPLAIAPQTLPPAPAPSATGKPSAPIAPIIGDAFRVDASGDVILKIVNTSSLPQQMEIKVEGVKTVDKNATVEVLTGQPTDVNTVDEPMKIVPHTEKIENAGTTFMYEFVPYSVNVIRLKTK